MDSILYKLRHHHWADGPIRRWLLILLLGGAFIAALGWMPGRWWTTAAFIIAALTYLIIDARAAGRDFVRFRPQSGGLGQRSDLTPLQPEDKVSVRATGLFGVEGKEGRYTHLEAWFRTFETREHAIIALVPRSESPGQRPEDQVGLWYIFFQPQMIQNLRRGDLTYNGETRPALEVQYRFTRTRERTLLGPRAEEVQERMYLSFENEHEREQVLANLRHDAGDRRR